jgi:hypothetical protein
MARNKNQHWVPQSYLRAWIDPNTPDGYDGYVHVFDRHGGHHREKGPANILSMPDLYTIFEDSKRNLRIENTFSKWEADFVRVRKVIEANQFGTGDDAADLYAFTGAMIARPPHRIKFVQDQWDTIVKKARSIRIDPNVAPMRPFGEGPSMTLDQAEEFVGNPMGTWFPEDVAANIGVLSELFGCDVLVNESEHPFLTSDAPAVVCYSSPNPRPKIIPRGLASEGCEITLPVSPRTALIFRHKAPGIHAFISADWKKVFELNFRTITRARKWIISDRQDIYFVKTIIDRVAEVDSRPATA